MSSPTGITRRIDLGLVNGEPFFNVASLGLSAELAQKLTRDIKRRCGRLGYALVALNVLSQARPFRATIASETETGTCQDAADRRRQRALLRRRQCGRKGCGHRRRSISISTAWSCQRAWKLALMARSFRYGEHGAWEEVRAVRAQEFDIRTRRPRPVNADGEIVTQTPGPFLDPARRP